MSVKFEYVLPAATKKCVKFALAHLKLSRWNVAKYGSMAKYGSSLYDFLLFNGLQTRGTDGSFSKRSSNCRINFRYFSDGKLSIISRF